MYNVNFGQTSTMQPMNLPREFVRPAFGMIYPEQYALSPGEMTNSTWPCGPQCGMGEEVIEPSSAKDWFKRNWKWVALGVGGVAAAGIVLKVVL